MPTDGRPLSASLTWNLIRAVVRSSACIQRASACRPPLFHSYIDSSQSNSFVTVHLPLTDTRQFLLPHSRLVQLYSSSLTMYAPSFFLAWFVSMSIDDACSGNCQTVEPLSILMDLFNVLYGSPSPFDLPPMSQYCSSDPGDYGTRSLTPYLSDYCYVRPLAVNSHMSAG